MSQLLDVILGITPVPGLSAAFSLLKITVSSVQQAREGKRQLGALAYAVAQLLDTLNTEFRASRLVQSASVKPLQDLHSLLEDIQCFIREEEERPFLRALFGQDSRISDIEAFYRRIGIVANEFQISALLNIQRMLSNDERARSQDLEGVQARLRIMELNQMQLWRTVGSFVVNPSLAKYVLPYLKV
ncbi:hypothetical protein B0H17DRAFT_1095969 [Mycena rosella]|uniref:Uncharacterized protein n=1 Tax=Mycena rosella TaxID=1033263 RepID=A0AAD7CRA0_MYCRO|nr:hypothetical protein B0H17DRAFT_1095969 [Mycena rosella]